MWRSFDFTAAVPFGTYTRLSCSAGKAMRHASHERLFNCQADYSTEGKGSQCRMYVGNGLRAVPECKMQNDSYRTQIVSLRAPKGRGNLRGEIMRFVGEGQ